MYKLKLKKQAELPAEGHAGTPPPAEPDWKQALPDAVRDWEEAKEATSAESFWGQITNMRARMGQSIRIPGEDASTEDHAAFNQRLMEKVPTLIQKPDPDNDEVMQAFFDQLGRPVESKQYVAPELTAPDGIVLQEDLPETFKDIAYRQGLTQKQYAGVVKEYSAVTVEQGEAQLSDHRASMNQLNKDWGVKYEGNLERAEAIRSKYFSEVIPNLNLAGAETIKAFSNLADRFGTEGSQALIEATRTQHSNALAPIEAQDKLNEILGNRTHAYWDAHDPGHQKAVEKVVTLTKMAHPEQTTDLAGLRGGVQPG